jgi:hypothetical protein
MADIRINSLPSTASSSSSDDFIAIDGATNGTRKLNAFSPTFGGNLTVSGTTGVTATDLILGSSGPSVKSSLSARAPRQGLVFDGTAGASMSTASLGTGDFTFSAVFKAPAITGSNYSWLFGGNTSMGIAVWTQGVRLTKVNVAEVTTFTATISPSLWYHLAVVKASGFITAYLNGVQIGTPFNDSAGTYTGSAVIGGYSGTSSLVTALSVISPLIYNRALSASEVVALYEAGAPATATYGGGVNDAGQTVTAASSTSLVTGANSNFSSDSGYWNKLNTVTISGGNCTLGSGAGIYRYSSSLVQRGKYYGFTVTISALSGTLTVGSNNGTTYLGVSSQASTTSTGTFSGYFYADNGNFIISVSGGGSATLTGFTIFPAGLLLAPDAAQAGGGLVWYDTSGNAANITLPASGVSWNVPSSLKLGGNWTAAGNLNASGGFYVSGSAVSPNNTACVDLSFQTTYGKVSAINRGVGNFPLALNPEGGSVLVNTTTNSGNGAIQLATHTTSAGGIGFGTDTSLFRTAAGEVGLDALSGTATVFGLRVAGTRKSYLYWENGTSTLTLAAEAASSSLKFLSANALALTLDSSQNATFAGKVTVSKANAGLDTSVTVNNTDSAANSTSSLILTSVAGSWTIQNNRSGGHLYFKDPATSATQLQINNSTGLATFAGSIAINNTVQTAAGVASTHKVTISIGGTTYYLLATNV